MKEIIVLQKKLHELDESLWKQSCALLRDCVEVLKWNIAFSELVCSYSGIQQLWYEQGEYWFFEPDDYDATLTLSQKIRLRYAREVLFEKIRKLPYTKWIRYNVSSQIYSFFRKEMIKLQEKYPESYNWDDFMRFLEYHLPDEMFEKLTDPTRFIRYVQDDSGKIIAYFESRENPMFPDTQVIQWAFTDESVRKKGVIRKIWDEYMSWCREMWYKSVWSYAAKRNDTSIKVHEALMRDPEIGISDSNTNIFVQRVDKIVVPRQ